MAAKAGVDASVADLSTLHEDALRQRILTRPVPRHVAIIMDGNGRWATSRGLPRVAGHGEGVKSLRSVVRAAGELGVQFLTIYAFSSENWQRPPHEVSTLMTLLERSIERELPELIERNVRFRAIGRREGLPEDVLREFDRTAGETDANTGMTLCLAINYGGRTEIVRSTEDLGPATANIAEELNHQYVLGYSSPHPGDGKYHSIRVTVAREGYRVRARQGYVASRRPNP